MEKQGKPSLFRESAKTVEARIEKLGEVQAFVDKLLECAACPIKTQMQIDLAIEEIFVNIAQYAYAPETGEAEIAASVRPGEVTLRFTDGGVPYDPLARLDPDVTLPADEREIGGLGIYMTKKVMDELHYERRDGKNILTMKKKL